MILFSRFPFLWVLLLLHFSLQTVKADTLILRMDSGVEEFSGVDVQNIVVEPTRTAFLVAMKVGDTPHEVEADRVQEIRFGSDPAAPGRFYDLTFAGVPGQQPFFPSSKVISFSDMHFMAVPLGMTQPERVPIRQLKTMVPGMVPKPTPIPMPRPTDEEFDEFYEDLEMPQGMTVTLDSGEVVNIPPDELNPPAAGGQDLLVSDPEQVETITFDEELSDQEAAALVGMGVALLVVLGIMLVMVFLNIVITVWMIIHAFYTGEIVYGILMIVICGGLPTLAYLFGNKYDGPLAVPIKIIFAGTYILIVLMNIIAFGFGLS
ncbi:MAG: hypothetical protein SFY68_01580 [Candidatus Sumerlaeia bacterium]|nr:hypothetical protein [Candidatus Sumerlaeia bacterium]